MSQFVTVLIFFVVGITYGNAHWASPIVSIINRWLCWITFSLVFSLIAVQMEWTYKPLELVMVVVFFGWFLLETIYNWLLINMLSKSPLPLFPKYVWNDKSAEWPAQRRFLRIKNWLRQHQFVRLQTLRALIGEGLDLRSSVYEDTEGHTRIQILLVPQRSNNVTACCIITSVTDKGERYITDNIFLPFGGFYPESWTITRKPWVRSLGRLMTIHKKKLVKSKAKLVSWQQTPLEDINQQQDLLERINAQRGFLFPKKYQGKYGRITREGRYRIWKEIWMLNYLGLSVDYNSIE